MIAEFERKHKNFYFIDATNHFPDHCNIVIHCILRDIGT